MLAAVAPGRRPEPAEGALVGLDLAVRVHDLHVLLQRVREGSRVAAMDAVEGLRTVHLRDVTVQILLRREHLTAVRTRYVADVPVTLHVVPEMSFTVRHEAAYITRQDQHFLVHDHLVSPEQMSCRNRQVE